MYVLFINKVCSQIANDVKDLTLLSLDVDFVVLLVDNANMSEICSFVLLSEVFKTETEDFYYDPDPNELSGFPKITIKYKEMLPNVYWIYREHYHTAGIPLTKQCFINNFTFFQENKY